MCAAAQSIEAEAVAKRRLSGAIALVSLCVVTSAIAQTFESNPLALDRVGMLSGSGCSQSEAHSRMVTGGAG